MIRIIDSQASFSGVDSRFNSAGNGTVGIRVLSRAIMGNPGDFSLILACCNSTRDRENCISLLKELIPIDIEDIVTSPGVDTLYSLIAKHVEGHQPEAVMVRGLESVVSINQLLISTNMMRDAFRKQFSFPLILWVNDDILRKIIKLAPDLKDWAATTIRFDNPTNKLVSSHPISA